MTDSPRPFVVFMRPGPCWTPEAVEFRLADLFGELYDGELWSTGTAAVRERPGALRVVMREFSDRKLVGRLRAWVGSLARGLYLRARVRGPMVFVCYDPFTTGSVGLVLKWLTRSTLIVEVNGTYGVAATFVGERGRFNNLKQKLMGIVGGRVLRSADLVKLLYPGQLKGLPVREQDLPVEVFFDSVDSSRFTDPPEARQEDVILFVGSPFLLKGIDLLLEAFGRLRADFPSWRLVLIGWALEEGAQRNGVPIPEGTDFLGPQKPEVVADWMDRCKIFVLPSRSEAMGRVLIEAGLKGRARVVSRVGGMPHIIREDETGLIFEAEDVDSLTHALRRLMEDPDFRRRIEAGARATCQAEFTQEAYRERYDGLIRRIAAPTGS